MDGFKEAVFCKHSRQMIHMKCTGTLIACPRLVQVMAQHGGGEVAQSPTPRQNAIDSHWQR